MYAVEAVYTSFNDMVWYQQVNHLGFLKGILLGIYSLTATVVVPHKHSQVRVLIGNPGDV